MRMGEPEDEAIYNFGTPNDLSALSSAPNLQAWWRMGENYGSFNGTMTNMANAAARSTSAGPVARPSAPPSAPGASSTPAPVSLLSVPGRSSL